MQSPSSTSKKDFLTGTKSTKVTTLRCAIDYIKSLTQLIDDINNGSLDPGKSSKNSSLVNYFAYKIALNLMLISLRILVKMQWMELMRH